MSFKMFQLMKLTSKTKSKKPIPSLTVGNFKSELARSNNQFASSDSVSNFATKSNGFAQGSHRAEVLF